VGTPAARIGDIERERAVAQLREHMAAGRLDSAEFEERMTAALQAKTQADLVPLFADLPRDPDAAGGVSLWRAPATPRQQDSIWRQIQRAMIFVAPLLWLLVFTPWTTWWIAYVVWGVAYIAVAKMADEDAKKRALGGSPRLPELD
jgi:hypothetical protein